MRLTKYIIIHIPIGNGFHVRAHNIRADMIIITDTDNATAKHTVWWMVPYGEWYRGGEWRVGWDGE